MARGKRESLSNVLADSFSQAMLNSFKANPNSNRRRFTVASGSDGGILLSKRLLAARASLHSPLPDK